MTRNVGLIKFSNGRVFKQLLICRDYSEARMFCSSGLLWLFLGQPDNLRLALTVTQVGKLIYICCTNEMEAMT